MNRRKHKHPDLPFIILIAAMFFGGMAHIGAALILYLERVR